MSATYENEKMLFKETQAEFRDAFCKNDIIFRIFAIYKK